eukprot:11223198-Lingulodinium_polyedra.AAC.1
MSHLIDGIPCVAKYPIDPWEINGAPMMTAKGWAKLRMNIAEKDLDNLQNVFDAAVKLGGKETLGVISEEEVEV